MANSSLSEHAFARPTLIGCHVVTFFDSIPSAENPRCTIGQNSRTRACQGVFALYYIGLPRVKCHLQGGPEQNAGLQFWGPFCATNAHSVHQTPQDICSYFHFEWHWGTGRPNCKPRVSTDELLLTTQKSRLCYTTD